MRSTALAPLKFLLLNQTFYPDVMATGQYLTEVALALAERGHQVTVLTSRRAYDDPHKLFPKQETWRGIRICRIASTGFGKAAKWRRAADFASFLFVCILRLALLPRPDAVVALTSPPLISFLGAWLARLRRCRFFYWVMDFNPDEAIAAGWLRANSPLARILERMSRFSLKRATKIIALDRFMQDRIIAKHIPAEKIAVVPPWSQDHDVRYDPEGRKSFRHAKGLEGKFVVMYSGNHSPCHPLDTLIGAARQLACDSSITFCFVGGGSEFRKIQQLEMDLPEQRSARSDERQTSGRLANIRCFPYQPLSELSASLSAADLHVVVMGEPFVGLVHPCKIYNILRVAAPVLYIGPSPSHVTQILQPEGKVSGNAQNYTLVNHGEVERTVQEIKRLKSCSLNAERILPHASAAYARETILPKLIAELESK